MKEREELKIGDIIRIDFHNNINNIAKVLKISPVLYIKRYGRLYIDSTELFTRASNRKYWVLSGYFRKATKKEIREIVNELFSEYDYQYETIEREQIKKKKKENHKKNPLVGRLSILKNIPRGELSL